eukprot:Blabericola_migrator_1__4945@NODE_2579_length_2577_cov_147_429482_g1615_i0_p2_GENE_NODE_2579_length_2577_cov_147_429482_g1615_i0NODE_2579_length_2577_cov_147_429482_g1615_i0_p2_ORF_typecomplete_len115_score15_63_NODE_2579_length_2577_cov_147_429482_g1615_i015681912
MNDLLLFSAKNQLSPHDNINLSSNKRSVNVTTGIQMGHAGWKDDFHQPLSLYLIGEISTYLLHLFNQFVNHVLHDEHLRLTKSDHAVVESNAVNVLGGIFELGGATPGAERLFA